jgi:hypothetical protein
VSLAGKQKRYKASRQTLAAVIEVLAFFEIESEVKKDCCRRQSFRSSNVCDTAL